MADPEPGTDPPGNPYRAGRPTRPDRCHHVAGKIGGAKDLRPAQIGCQAVDPPSPHDLRPASSAS
jgi:hypothetical protein